MTRARGLYIVLAVLDSKVPKIFASGIFLYNVDVSLFRAQVQMHKCFLRISFVLAVLEFLVDKELIDKLLGLLTAI